MTKDNDHFISIGQVAKLFGTSTETIRQWEKAGCLSSQKPDGKNRLFSPTDIRELQRRQPMTVTKAAAYLNIPTPRLRELEAARQLKPSYQSDNCRVYTKNDLDQYLANQPILNKHSEKT